MVVLSAPVEEQRPQLYAKKKKKKSVCNLVANSYIDKVIRNAKCTALVLT